MLPIAIAFSLLIGLLLVHYSQIVTNFSQFAASTRYDPHHLTESLEQSLQAIVQPVQPAIPAIVRPVE